MIKNKLIGIPYKYSDLLPLEEACEERVIEEKNVSAIANYLGKR